MGKMILVSKNTRPLICHSKRVQRLNFGGFYQSPSLAYFRRRSRKSRRQNQRIKGVAALGGAYVLGNTAIQSGVPRLLGIRMEQHGTSSKAARQILGGGGYLDPHRGGEKGVRMGEMLREKGGDRHGIDADTFKKKYAKQVYVTGYHPDTKAYERAKKAFGVDLPNNPLAHVAYRSGQSRAHAIQAELDFDKIAQARNSRAEKTRQIGAALGKGKVGKILYAPGTDRDFRENFRPDIGDLALMSDKKVKVYGNKASAVAGHLQEKGVHGTLDGMNQNKGRVLAGAAIAGAGGYGAYKLGKVGVDSFVRRDESGKRVRVRGHRRKRNPRRKRRGT